jgi:putative flippase GtrA
MENVKQKRLMKNPLNEPIAKLAQKYGGENPKELERFLRFAVVGVLGAVIDLGILILLQATILPPNNALGEPLKANIGMATTIAFLSAVVSNFIWTTIWVYPDSGTHSKKKQLVQFTVLSIIGWMGRTIWVSETSYWIGSLVMPILLPIINFFDPSYLSNANMEVQALAEGRFGSITSQMIAMVIVMFWNFFANRHWTYNDVD